MEFQNAQVIAIPLIQIALRVLLSLAVALGLQQIWAAVVAAVGHFINKKAAWFKVALKLSVLGQLVQGFAKPVIHQGQTDIGVEAKTREPAGSAFAGGLAAMFAYHAFTLKYLAAGTLEGFDVVKRHAIPAGARSATRPAREQSERASRQARTARKGAAAATAGSIAARRAADRAGHQAKAAQAEALRATHAVAVPAPRALPDVWRKEIDTGINRWISKHLGRLATGIAAALGLGLMVRVLVRHLPWFQCRNVDKVARSLCRMPTDLLDDLLGLVTLFGVSLSIVEFAESVQEITEGAEKAVRLGISELRHLPKDEADNAAKFLALLGD